ncbi:MAG: hypothetical protein R3E96_11790 [Planctomycetota bacterium]
MRLPVLCLAGLLLAACQSGPNPTRQYERILDELGKQAGTQALRPEGRAKLEELYGQFEAWQDQGVLHSGEDKLWAAAALVNAESPTRIERAHDLALQSVSAGEVRANPVLAQAIDKLDLQAGRPQTYGTQFVYHDPPGIWDLYRLNPITTDEQRIAMGVPTLAELDQALMRLNEKRQEEFLKWAEAHRPARRN